MEEARTLTKQMRILAAGVFGLLLLRIVCGAWTELLPEEAYYWTYTQHPALGYFDHPPMIAWVIRFGTMLFGETELGIRFGNILLAAATCWLVVRVTEMWFDRRAALVAGWMYLLAPVFVAMGFLGMPDMPLLFFWMVTLYAVTRALREDRGAWWWLAGIGFGGAMLSKYYAAAIAPSLLAFLLMTPRYRVWLRRPQPWLALALALVLFSPVILWNAQNDWVSFAFQSGRATGQKASGWVESMWFWLMQVVLPTPLLFVLMVMGTARGWKPGRGEGWNFTVAFSLPVFAVFALASARGAFRMNWTAPAMISLLPAAAALLVEMSEKARWWRRVDGVTAVVCALIILIGHVELAAAKVGWLSFVKLGGWGRLADEVEKQKTALAQSTGQKPFVLGADKYNLAAELGFYMRDPFNCVNPFALGEQGLGYRYWTDLEKFRGRPAVIVLSRAGEKDLAKLRPHFEKLDPPQLVRVYAGKRLQRKAYVVTGYGYSPDKSEPGR
jgi:dolichol-phosphate mannosyltransferase